MKPIDHKLLRRFLKIAGDRLSGDWVIIGGTVLLLKGIMHRVTHDIDIAGSESASQKDLRLLFEIAEELGLPIEAINQAAPFFLHQIKGWKSDLEKIHSGKKAKLYCPSPTLFIRLKIRRLTDTDLQDCLHLLRKRPELDKKILERELVALIRTGENPERGRRAEELLNAIRM